MRLKVSTPDKTIGELDCAPFELVPIFQTLKKENGSFFILSKSEADFLQGVWYKDKGFYLEYFDADAEGHQATPDLLSTDLALLIAELYRREDLAWKEQCGWEYQEALEPLEPERDGCMGHFDGVALRHVLAELERRGIPCRLEPDAGGFLVFVPPEHDEIARQVISSLFPH